MFANRSPGLVNNNFFVLSPTLTPPLVVTPSVYNPAQLTDTDSQDAFEIVEGDLQDEPLDDATPEEKPSFFERLRETYKGLSNTTKLVIKITIALAVSATIFSFVGWALAGFSAVCWATYSISTMGLASAATPAVSFTAAAVLGGSTKEIENTLQEEKPTISAKKARKMVRGVPTSATASVVNRTTMYRRPTPKFILPAKTEMSGINSPLSPFSRFGA